MSKRISIIQHAAPLRASFYFQNRVFPLPDVPMPRLIGGEGILSSRPQEEKIVQMHANVNVRHKGEG